MLHKEIEYGELLKKYFPSSEYQLDVEIVNDPPEEYIKDFFEKLSKHEKFLEIKDDFIYDADMKVFIHIHNRFHKSELVGLTEEEIFFYPFMDKKEIKRIFNINSASDYLLRLRAEQVENEIRLLRTFSKLKKRLGDKWSFTNYFDSKQYKKYLSKLKLERKNLCVNIPHGTIHANEANGMCVKTPFGNIIILSYALREFLYYMNIFFYGKQLGVKANDVMYSFIIATRIMMGNESLDFEIDPRGELPKRIHRQIELKTDWQMNFIIGHEYAHHYLGHLDSHSKLKSHDKINIVGEKINHYTYSQKCEFEADRHSITEAEFNNSEKRELIDGAFLFLISLHLLYRTLGYLSPKMSNSVTHPEPIDRMWKLRDSIDENIGMSKIELRNFADSYDKFMDTFIKDYLPYNVDKIEMRGSVYLPGYKKKILIDRLDI